MTARALLGRRFYQRGTERVARDLLGHHLVRESVAGITMGRIVEVEAYVPEGDPANHAHRGMTPRNAAMFGPAGRAYVYMIHARHCLNMVTEREGIGCAVLIRAVEPLEGLELMRTRRGSEPARDLARGPGRLCEAFDVTRELNCWDLTRREQLWVERAWRGTPPFEITAAPRVGISVAATLPLRFFISGSPYVSKPGYRARAPRPTGR